MTTPVSDRVVLHIAGVDRPGITARLTETITREQAYLVDVAQTVLHGYLMLSIVVDLPAKSDALRHILLATTDLGLRLEVRALPMADPVMGSRTPGICVTLLGPLSNGLAVHQCSGFLAERGMNIREVRPLSEGELRGLELIADWPSVDPMSSDELANMRGTLLRLAGELGVDMGVQRDDVFRRNKRLVCMDVDSTFVQGEFIDELAALVGVKDQVADITARAMRGEIGFKQALAERVKLLEGLPMSRVLALGEQLHLMPGAPELVRALKLLGFKVGLVSGGFDFFVEGLRRKFGLDFAFANELEVRDGKLTGRVQGTIVDGERKAQLLRDMAKVYDCRLEQTVAVGDGANDMLMLQAAGLGIAFRAKPKLQEVADMSLNFNDRLDALLPLMGFDARMLRAMTSGAGP